jgi:SAM-dependent methyltransferase
MSTEFNINEYWLRRGKTYADEGRLAGAYHRLQERFLLDILSFGWLRLESILEIGCGFGRITRLLAEAIPTSRITALDLSPDQLEHAKQHCGGCANIQFGQYDFYSDAPLPGLNYDLAVAVEVFLHHPPKAVTALIRKLAGTARFIVNIDWSEDWPWPTSEHVWVHDFQKIYRQAGLECAGFALPQKVDGKQQRLFIAGRTMPPNARRLERLLSMAAGRAATAGSESRRQPFEPHDWDAAVRQSEEDIQRVIPPNNAFVLVNDEQWRTHFTDRWAIPFLEKDGVYWGPPADDDTALRELERLRETGVGYLVMSWPCFWWFEHYTGFARHMRSSFPCLLENERVIIFKLRP